MDNKLTVPLSIVVAGALIAGAIFLTNKDTGGNVAVNNTQQQKIQKTAMAIRPINVQEHLLGNPNAPLVVVEFSDTECPFCKNFHTTMHKAIEEYGKEGEVAWAYRHFPIDQLHPKARKESEATECAADLGGNAKFWEYTDLLYKTTPSNNLLDAKELPVIAVKVGLDVNAFNTCLSSGKYAKKVETDYQEAVSAGGRGTPFSIIVSKQKLNSKAEELFNQLAAQLPANTIVISEDKFRVSVSGALPYDLLSGIFDIILGKN